MPQRPVGWWLTALAVSLLGPLAVQGQPNCSDAGSSCQNTTDSVAPPATPCQNGASCQNGNDGVGYTCACVAGWTGVNCADMVGCETAPCLHGGVCTDYATGGYNCACASEFTGVNCAAAAVNPDHPHYLGNIEVWNSSIDNHTSWPGYDDVVPMPGYTTYRLRLPLVQSISPTLSGDPLNVYAIFGDWNNIPHVPAPYFDTFATDHTQPPSSSFFEMSPTMFNDLMLTSFISVGNQGPITATNPAPNLGVVGDAINEWSSTSPLTLGQNPGPTEDFSLFWMEPNSATLSAADYPNGPLLAQLTLPTEQPFFVQLGVQGQSSVETDPDYSATVVWVYHPNQSNGECPAGQEHSDAWPGDDCTLDIGAPTSLLSQLV
eukprot:COSAG05_NODE_1271_length_5315_cov_2.397738_8_plen_376_part_00